MDRVTYDTAAYCSRDKRGIDFIDFAPFRHWQQAAAADLLSWENLVPLLYT